MILKIVNPELLKEQIDITQIQINTKISREQILEQHPDMKMRDNIFYLEKEEDDE